MDIWYSYRQASYFRYISQVNDLSINLSRLSRCHTFPEYIKKHATSPPGVCSAHQVLGSLWSPHCGTAAGPTNNELGPKMSKERVIYQDMLSFFMVWEFFHIQHHDFASILRGLFSDKPIYPYLPSFTHTETPGFCSWRWALHHPARLSRRRRRCAQALWRSALPSRVPLAEDVDFAALGAYDLDADGIASAAFRACAKAVLRRGWLWGNMFVWLVVTGTWILFFHIFGIIIPTDLHILEGGSTTNQLWVSDGFMGLNGFKIMGSNQESVGKAGQLTAPYFFWMNTVDQ